MVMKESRDLEKQSHRAFSACTSFPRCGRDDESVEHLLFFCPFAQVTWKASRFSYSSSLIGFPYEIKLKQPFMIFWRQIKIVKVSPKSTPTVITQWTPPDKGVVKVNCDASFDKFSGMAAEAAIARDWSGTIVDGTVKSFCTISASTAEASSKILNSWESFAIEEEILNLISSFPSYDLLFVHRCCNIDADWVAKAVRSNSYPFDWSVLVPLDLRILL
ncbi:hypothetical protein GQ457_04G024390 [Hibiscus cannabinus]